MIIKKNAFLKIVLLFTAAVSISLPATAKSLAHSRSFSGQTANQVAVSDYKLNSKLMAREMPYRVALPKNYSADTQARFPVVILLHGLSGHFDNWGSKTKIAEYLAPFNFIVVMPEGDNGWYTDSATVPNDKYESYIMQELVPEIDKNFHTVADRDHRIIAGLSMGGYGSLKFGLKHPEMFGLVGSFSGALGAAGWTEKLIGTKGTIPESLKSVYGNEDSQTRHDNDIFRMVKDINQQQINALPFVYLDCGTEDFLIQNNHDFVALLNEKKIPHEFRERPGAHTWEYWDAQIQEFLRLADRFVSKSKTKAA